MINNPAPVGVIARNTRATFNLLSQKVFQIVMISMI